MKKIILLFTLDKQLAQFANISFRNNEAIEIFDFDSLEHLETQLNDFHPSLIILDQRTMKIDKSNIAAIPLLYLGQPPENNECHWLSFPLNSNQFYDTIQAILSKE